MVRKGLALVKKERKARDILTTCNWHVPAIHLIDLDVWIALLGLPLTSIAFFPYLTRILLILTTSEGYW